MKLGFNRYTNFLGTKLIKANILAKNGVPIISGPFCNTKRLAIIMLQERIVNRLKVAQMIFNEGMPLTLKAKNA